MSATLIAAARASFVPVSSICVDCFQAGDHEGHDFIVYSSGFGGCCDCGNELAWTRAGFCSNHRGRDGSHAADTLAPAMRPIVEHVFEAVLVEFKLLLRICHHPDGARLPLAIIAWLRRTIAVWDALRYLCGCAMLSTCVSATSTTDPLDNLAIELGGSLPYAIGDQLINLFLEVPC